MNNIFSIIVPTYKNYVFLMDCIDSVLSQDYESLELIVVDDGTPDFDCDYWINYIDRKKESNLIKTIVYSNGVNLGTVKSLNGAIKKSSGNYIKILAADDVLNGTDTISLLKEKIDKSDEECFVCDVLLCDEKLNEKKLAKNKFIKKMESLSPKKCFSGITVRNPINATGVVFKKDFFENNGYFDERFILLEDWPTWLSIFKSGKKIKYLDILIARRRVSTGVVSNGNPLYLKDRKNAWDIYIKGCFKTIGLFKYIGSFITSRIFTIGWIRKLSYLFLGKK